MNNKQKRLKKLKELWIRNSWMIAGILGFFGFVLGVYGFTPIADLEALSDVLYKTLQMAVLEFGETRVVNGEPEIVLAHHLSRILLPAALSIAVIQGILSAIHRRGGSVMLRFLWKDHVVICGSGFLASEIAKAHLSGGGSDKVALAYSGSEDNQLINSLIDDGAVVLCEDPSTHDAMVRLSLNRARVIYIVSDDEQTNLRLFSAITAFINETKNLPEKPVCLLHCHNRILGQRVLDTYLNKSHGANSDLIEVRPFNPWRESARALYQKLGPDVFHPIRRDTLYEPHAIIIGRNRFSEQLIDQGAFLGHYIGDKKLRITLLGAQSDEWLRETLIRHPALNPKMPIGFWSEEEKDLVPVINLEADAREDYTQFFLEGKGHVEHSVIYICIDSLPDALEIAQSVAHVTVKTKSPIVVCAPEVEENWIDLPHAPLPATDEVMASRVYGFSTTGNALRLQGHERFVREELDAQATALHRAFTGQNGSKNRSDCNKQNTAEGSPFFEWMRESSRQAVSHLVIKARAVGKESELKTPNFFESLTQEETNLLSRMEHQRWCAERLMYGWRFGTRDNKNLRHPDLKKFDALDAKAQKKDETIVKSLSALSCTE